MKPRLLIVDDDASFCSAHQSALAEAFDVEIAQDPQAALRRLGETPFQAVLIAVEVARNQGYTLCSTLRKQEAMREVRVALISAQASASEFARHGTLRGRADAYLRKPMDSRALVASLQAMLSQPSAAVLAKFPEQPFWKRWWG
ncbi:MAG TPA: response regulator [Holophagaceae bacterium]|nr:response regulator [Holophagaceae bacterium]